VSELFAIVPAAGSGARFGGEHPKQYAQLAGAPMLVRSLERLMQALPLERIVVAVAPGDAEAGGLLAGRERVSVMRCGGTSRAETVRNALAALREHARDEDWVLVHDAARPCVPVAALRRLVFALRDDSIGGLLAIPVADTLKRAAAAPTGDPPRVGATEDRTGLWAAQTPQMFRVGVLARALAEAAAGQATDEAQAVERLGLSPRLVPGSAENLKVTLAADLVLATAIWRAQEEVQ